MGFSFGFPRKRLSNGSPQQCPPRSSGSSVKTYLGESHQRNLLCSSDTHTLGHQKRPRVMRIKSKLYTYLSRGGAPTFSTAQQARTSTRGAAISFSPTLNPEQKNINGILRATHQRFALSFLVFVVSHVFKRYMQTYSGVSMVSFVVPGTVRVPPCPEGDCP